MTTKNQSGIAIKIEMFLPTGATIEEAYTALSMVRDATETGDYTSVLAAAKMDSIVIKQVNRRTEVVEPTPVAELLPEGTPGEHAADNADAPVDTVQEMPLTGRTRKPVAA